MDWFFQGYVAKGPRLVSAWLAFLEHPARQQNFSCKVYSVKSFKCIGQLPKTVLRKAWNSKALLGPKLQWHSTRFLLMRHADFPLIHCDLRWTMMTFCWRCRKEIIWVASQRKCHSSCVTWRRGTGKALRADAVCRVVESCHRCLNGN